MQEVQENLSNQKLIIFSVIIGLVLTTAAISAGIYFAKKTLSNTQPSSTIKKPQETSSDYFEHIKTIEPLPDNYYTNGNFCDFYYFPQKDKFYLSFATGQYTGKETYKHPGYAYKEFDLNLIETGKTGFFHENINQGIIGGDGATVFADGYLYLLKGGGPEGWILEKFDQDFNLIKQTTVNLDRTQELGNDQMLAFVNDMLDASSLYAINIPENNEESLTDNLSVGGPEVGEATHHHFYTPDLEFIERKVLQDSPHVNGSSMVYHNGIYNLITSTAWFGDLIVMQYDQNWNYIGNKELAKNGRWSMGTVYVDKVFYVVYASQNRQAGTNIILAAFDEQWNPLGKIIATDSEKDPTSLADRPAVMHHDGLLYVSYDFEPQIAQGQKKTDWWRCKISVYKPK
jgi:hypothetical protein